MVGIVEEVSQSLTNIERQSGLRVLLLSLILALLVPVFCFPGIDRSKFQARRASCGGGDTTLSTLCSGFELCEPGVAIV